MGYNTPDDCPWNSDADYYESRGRYGVLDADDDPTPEIYTCEHCEQDCLEPYSTDPITECCHCANEQRPKRAAPLTPCELCQGRESR